MRPVNLAISPADLRRYPASLRHAARAAWEPLRKPFDVVVTRDDALVPLRH